MVELFQQVFGRPLTERQYLWKLVETPLRVGAPNAWLAESGDRIVGHYAGTPMRFQLEGDVVSALHGCDVMTAPDFRGRGVLTSLGTEAREAWSRADIALVTGLHYGGWGTRRHALGWREQFRTVHLWRPLRVDRLVQPFRWLLPRIAAPGAAPRDVAVTAISRPGAEFDELWRLVGAEHDSLVVRDREWLTYRYADSPSGDYRMFLAARGAEPTGYLVLRVIRSWRKVALIVDLFSAPHDESTRETLVRRAVAEAIAAGAQGVRIYVSEGTALLRELSNLGFRRAKGHFDVSIIPLDAARDYTGMSNPRRWLTMPGDFDVF